MQGYLDAMEYGNKDLSGSSLTDSPWINSSLKISPTEQVHFLKRMIEGKLSISQKATQLTKEILFKENLPEGWKLYGKSGWSESDMTQDGKLLDCGWFVGWIERGDRFFPFAYMRHLKKSHYDPTISRVKELLFESNIMDSDNPLRVGVELIDSVF